MSEQLISRVKALRRPAPLVAISVFYLVAATVLMTWRGIEVSPDYILLLLVPIALLAGRFIQFLKDWVPFIALFLGYEGMRGIAPKLGAAVHIGDLAALERLLFLGQYPSQLLQNLASAEGWSDAASFAATAIYLCHFIFPFAVGLVLWHMNRRQFLRYTTALLAMSFAAFVFYLLAPTAPPWYANSQGSICCVQDLINNSLPTAWSPIYHLFNGNSFAAFPSMHAAYPFLGYLAMRPLSKLGGRLILGWAILVWIVVVFLGQHYVVDVMAGVLFAVLGWKITTHYIAAEDSKTLLAAAA